MRKAKRRTWKAWGVVVDYCGEWLYGAYEDHQHANAQAVTCRSRWSCKAKVIPVLITEVKK